jgi:outer membrane receptor protein involved in Fe transport
MKRIITLWCLCVALDASADDLVVADSVRNHLLEEALVTASHRETNIRKKLPGSASFVDARTIESLHITGIKGLSAMIPNLFIPDYGSKYTVPVYIRGIGERSTGQCIGMYVDNMPVMDRSAFDTEWADVLLIEVLRGPQGTLFGRNAMGGMINITTPSPLRRQYRKASAGAGSYGRFESKIAVSERLSMRTGLSVNACYDRDGGYFVNKQTGQSADRQQSAGAGIRIDHRINPSWTVQWTSRYDWLRQGAFPYGDYDSGEIAGPDYNFPGSYARRIAGNNLNVHHANDLFTFNANTGFQYLQDDMKMDVDYSASDMFRLNQSQSERSWTEELTLRSRAAGRYQWSFGLFGFLNSLHTEVTTTLASGAIQGILQPVFDEIAKHPSAPSMTIIDDEIPIPGRFRTPDAGGAVFHQSTVNDLFVQGLSLTAGLRLDCETVRLNYNTGMAMHLRLQMGARPLGVQPVDTLLSGNEKLSFTELLPKLALRYEWNERQSVYLTAAKGYKTGGYNIQSFADVVQNAAMSRNSGQEQPSVRDQVAYRPEYSWNYEAGYKGEIVRNRLFAEVAAFYTDVKDMQLTDFVQSGQGRMLKNAGQARSMGFESTINCTLSKALTVAANYGFTKATVNDGVNPEARNVPFAPRNTLSLNVAYEKLFRNTFIDRCRITTQYTGVGRIYWTEENDIYQPFYGLLDFRIGLTKGIAEVNFRVNNLLNTRYAAFYFESMGRHLAQAGRPVRLGVDVAVSF